MRRHSGDITFGLLVAAALGVGVLAVLIWTGHFVSDGGGPAVARRQAPTTEHGALPAPPAASHLAETRPARPVAQTTMTIEIDASRGDCWVSARKGSESGAALMERVLRQGETVTLRGRRIWLQLGAAGNVDVTVDGKDRQIPSGTTDVVLG
jgi:hypothetical protein